MGGTRRLCRFATRLIVEMAEAFGVRRSGANEYEESGSQGLES